MYRRYVFCLFITLKQPLIRQDKERNSLGTLLRNSQQLTHLLSPGVGVCYWYENIRRCSDFMRII
jgi:hypothetical protein